MKEREEENKQKEKNTIQVQAEVHRETPWRPPTERKQWELTQMILPQGRLAMNVENVDVNVEVLSTNAKHALTAKIAQDFVQKFMAQPVQAPVTQARPWVHAPITQARPRVQAMVTQTRPHWATALPVVRPQVETPVVRPQVHVHVVRPQVQAPLQPHVQAPLQPIHAESLGVTSAVQEIRFRAGQMGNRCRRLPFEMDEYMKDLVAKAKQIKKD